MKTILRIEGMGTQVYEGDCSVREAMGLAGLVKSEWNIEKAKESATKTEYVLTRRQAADAGTGKVLHLPHREDGNPGPEIEKEAGGAGESASSAGTAPAAVQPESVGETAFSGEESSPGIPAGGITVDREEFLSALQIVCDITAKKHLMPLLGMVRVEARAEEITVTATDLELSFQATIPGLFEGSDTTAFLVDAGILYKEVKALGKAVEEAVIAVRDHSIKINGRCVLPASPTDDFPEIPAVEGSEVVVKDLAAALSCVLPAVGTDEARYVLTGVCFDLAEGCLVGTDGFRLHRADVEKADVARFILPRRAAGILARYGADRVTITESRLASPLAGGTFTARLIDGDYPDYKGIWPDTGRYDRVQFNAKEFLELLPGVLPVSDDAKIDMTINGRIDIEAESVTGSYRWYVPAKSSLAGKTTTMTINSRFLVDAIRSYMASEEIEMSFPSGYGAVVVNNRALIMPVRR